MNRLKTAVLILLLAFFAGGRSEAATPCIKHVFVNPQADGADATVTRPSDWNACHDVEDAAITANKLASAVNAQTGTTYIVLNTDRGKLVTLSNGSPVAVTLPQAGAGSAFIAGWFADVQNRGAGTATITPTTSTIDGAASLALTQGQGIRIFSDGTNYFTQRGVGGAADTDDQTAAEVPFTPVGTIAASDTQTAVAEVATDAASALSTHEADTTSIHGIADTSALETTTGAQTKVDTHVNDTTNAHDAGSIGYTPLTLPDWADSLDPGDVDNALDQVADRLLSVESGKIGGTLTLGTIPRASGAKEIEDGSCTDDGAGTIQCGAGDEGIVTVGKIGAAGANYGTAGQVLTSGGAAGNIAWTAPVKSVQAVVFDFATATATGDGKFYFRIPSTLNGYNLTAVSANVIAAGTTGTLNVDLARCAATTAGAICTGTGTSISDMLTTNLTIDSGENDSATAAAAAVINTTADDVATGQVIRIDIDAVHTTPATGLIVNMDFTLP